MLSIKKRFKGRAFSLYLVALLFVNACIFIGDSGAYVDEESILKMKQAYPQRDEYSYLPKFCAVKLEELKYKGMPLPANISRAQKMYTKKLGTTTWTYMHHYCAALNRIGRFERSLMFGIGSRTNMTKHQRGTLLYALNEYKMIQPPYKKSRSPLYVETIKNYAKVFHLLGRTSEAILKIKEGLAYNPRKDTLYLYYAEILLDIGRKQQAKQVLELGYKRTNGSKRINKVLSSIK